MKVEYLQGAPWPGRVEKGVEVGALNRLFAQSMVTIHVYSQTVKDMSRHVFKVIRKEQSKV